jgi:hypothetical protein
MLRRAVEVAAITGSLAAAAGIAAMLQLGSTRSIPGIAGAALVAGVVFFRRRRSTRDVVLAVLLSGIAAFIVDWYLLFVLGAGHPELRAIRQGPFYQASMVAIFGAIAAADATPASDEPLARS